MKGSITLFGLFKKKAVNKADKTAGQFRRLWDLDICGVWALEDPSDFLVAMNGWIGKKCGYGNNMAALSAYERVFYITQSCAAEVSNGGFAQFFFNSSGNFSCELVRAFTEIGAAKTAQICSMALGAFGGALPTDSDERQKALAAMGNDEVDIILEECSVAFLKDEDDLALLSYSYVIQNKGNFS